MEIADPPESDGQGLALRSMESDGIITRTVYPEVPPRVEYALSELGESMRPIISAMELWGRAYQERVRKD